MSRMSHEEMMEILLFASEGGEVACDDRHHGPPLREGRRMTVSNELGHALTLGRVMSGNTFLSLTPMGQGFVDRRKAAKP